MFLERGGISLQGPNYVPWVPLQNATAELHDGYISTSYIAIFSRVPGVPAQGHVVSTPESLVTPKACQELITGHISIFSWGRQI